MQKGLVLLGRLHQSSLHSHAYLDEANFSPTKGRTTLNIRTETKLEVHSEFLKVKFSGVSETRFTVCFHRHGKRHFFSNFRTLEF